jgi:hypothetical protein
MANSRQVALGYADVKATQVAQIWAENFKPAEELENPLETGRMIRVNRVKKSDSDRRIGTAGRSHRLTRASIRHALTVSKDREKDFETAAERKLRHHFVHHITIAKAKVHKAVLEAKSAIDQFPY